MNAMTLPTVSFLRTIGLEAAFISADITRAGDTEVRFSNAMAADRFAANCRDRGFSPEIVRFQPKCFAPTWYVTA